MNDYTPPDLDATTRRYRKTAAQLSKDAAQNKHIHRVADGLPKYENISCSSCGEDFGPGDEGFSHCANHEAGILCAPEAKSETEPSPNPAQSGEGSIVKRGPILFSGPLVCAILERRKTQTRRVIKPEWYRCLDLENPKDVAKALGRCRYGEPGDHLYVRETWAPADLWESGYEREKPQSIRFRADGKAYTYGPNGEFHELDTYAWSQPDKWRPSIFMPKWASRIELLLKGIRVQRLQDISWQDAIAEGIEPVLCAAENPVDAFAGLWDSINAKRGYPWHTNPWVWALDFERCEK